MPDLPATSEIARLARSPSALLNHLSNMASDEEPDGSCQPPDLPDANGSGATTQEAGTDGAPADAGGTAGADADAPPPPIPEAAPAPSATEPPRAALRSTPHGRPRRPGPPRSIVPGDPTLN